MEARKTVFRETAIVAVGVAVCLGLMIGVYALLGKLTAQVAWGGAIGSALAIGNFFMMAVNVSLAADKAAGQDVKGGKALVKVSYFTRLAVIFLVLFACVKGGVADPLASILPLVFVRPVLTVAEFFRK